MIRNAWFRRARTQTLIYSPLLIAGPVLIGESIGTHSVQWLLDFHYGLYNAGVSILHGRPVYQAGFLAHQVSIMHSGRIAMGELNSNEFSVPAYPAFANLLIVPFALLPLWLGGVVYTVASIAAVLGALRLLGVRDPRCHAVALISWPFLLGATLGAVGPCLLLGTGAAWYWRDRIWPVAVAVASIVAIKIFPWTLGVWLFVTRRYRALAVAVILCVAVTLGAWAAIGFAGMLQYPRMLSDLSLLQEGRGISVVTVALIAGASPHAASLIAMSVGAAILGLGWRLASGPDGDRRAFGLAIIATLATTPIVWEHYMLLLFVPVALTSPQLSRLWLAPLCSPIMVALSRVVIGNSHRIQAYSPNALRQALSWLLIEFVVGFCLCTTGEQRSAIRGALRLRRRPAVPLTVAAACDEA